MMLEKLACHLGRKDEGPNIELAEELCANGDGAGVAEIAARLKDKNKAVANDCIKVIYETGYRKPELVAPYAGNFIPLLLSKNNRLAWGAMIALGTVADLAPGVVAQNLDTVIKAYEQGSVITVDNSITVFAKLCKAGAQYEKEVFPILLAHLSRCRAKEISQHAERMAICIHAGNREEFISVLEGRRTELTPAQEARINRVIKGVRAI